MAYVIFFVTFLDDLIESEDYDIYLLMTIIVIVTPLCLVSKVTFFAKTSALGSVFILFTLIVTVFYNIKTIVDDDN